MDQNICNFCGITDYRIGKADPFTVYAQGVGNTHFANSGDEVCITPEDLVTMPSCTACPSGYSSCPAASADPDGGTGQAYVLLNNVNGCEQAPSQYCGCYRNQEAVSQTDSCDTCPNGTVSCGVGPLS